MARVWTDAGVWLERFEERAHEAHDDDHRELLALMVERPVPRGEQAPRTRARLPAPDDPRLHRKLDREQATAARELALEVGTNEAARRYGVAPPTLRDTWKRYDIALPGRRQARRTA